MNFNKFVEFIVYLHLYCTVCMVWAQTTNSVPFTTPVSANTDTITQSNTQTPKTLISHETTNYKNVDEVTTTLGSIITTIKGITDTNQPLDTQTTIQHLTENSKDSSGTTIPPNPTTLLISSIGISNTQTVSSSVVPHTGSPHEVPSLATQMSSQITNPTTISPNIINEISSKKISEMTAQSGINDKTTTLSTNVIQETQTTTLKLTNDVNIMTTTAVPLITSQTVEQKSSAATQTTIDVVNQEASLGTTQEPIRSSTLISESKSTLIPIHSDITESSVKTTLFSTTLTNGDKQYIPPLNHSQDIQTQTTSPLTETTTETRYLNATDIHSIPPNIQTESQTPTHGNQLITTTEAQTSSPIISETHQTIQTTTTAQPIETLRTLESVTRDHTDDNKEPNITPGFIENFNSSDETKPVQTSDMAVEVTSVKTIETTDETQNIQSSSESTKTFDDTLTQPHDSNTIETAKTNSQPLVHDLTTTHNMRPITTSIPFESNVNPIKVILPNIKSMNYINKEDMVNTVTITFIAKSVEIFRFITILDLKFRNFTCDCIDSERNWCQIDNIIYVSPSPLVMNNHLIISFFVNDSKDKDLNKYHVFKGPLIVESLKNSTKTLEQLMGLEVQSLQTNMGTIVVKPLESDSHRLAKFELLVFIFTIVMFICTVLLCLAIICSCAKRKSVDMNQIQLSNAFRRQTTTNLNGFDLNSASNILRDELHAKRNHNVINLEEGWVTPIDNCLDNEKNNAKYDSLQDTKL